MPPPTCVHLCECWLCTHACPPAPEWITDTHSHIISAGSPQWNIPEILLHISKEHNVLLLSGATLIRGKDFYCFSAHFLTPFLCLFSPPSLLNLSYFQTPPAVIISFPSFSPVSLPLFYYFCLPCHPSPLVISYLISLRCYYATTPILTPSLRLFFPLSLSSVCLC